MPALRNAFTSASTRLSPTRARTRSMRAEWATDLRLQIEERDEDLAAARAGNRELMTWLNAPRS